MPTVSMLSHRAAVFLHAHNGLNYLHVVSVVARAHGCNGKLDFHAIV